MYLFFATRKGGSDETTDAYDCNKGRHTLFLEAAAEIVHDEEGKDKCDHEKTDCNDS